MRIFLSFASEQKDIAEPIALGLRNSGHDVFFSHDDLPPATSFDLRVQTAIERSDLLIFLVSPESVTRGRYTLTELEFARDRWPRADGHVLPVIIATTPKGKIPNYLKAVTFLEPQGNVAAEVSAAVRGLNPDGRPGLWTPLVFVMLGLASGLASHFGRLDGSAFVSVQLLAAADKVSIPLMPGIYFGLAIAIGTYLRETRALFDLVLVLLFIFIGWMAAYYASANTALFLNRYYAPGEGGARVQLPYVLAVAGVCGGLVGSFLTALGVSVASRHFRRIDCWSMTIAVGAAAGLLLETSDLKNRDFAGLFLIWQILVAGTIGYRLAKAKITP